MWVLRLNKQLKPLDLEVIIFIKRGRINLFLYRQVKLNCPTPYSHYNIIDQRMYCPKCWLLKLGHIINSTSLTHNTIKSKQNDNALAYSSPTIHCSHDGELNTACHFYGSLPIDIDDVIAYTWHHSQMFHGRHCEFILHVEKVYGHSLLQIWWRWSTFHSMW